MKNKKRNRGRKITFGVREGVFKGIGIAWNNKNFLVILVEMEVLLCME